jgi:hypothetical protein
MALDAGIYGRYNPKSVADFDREHYTAEGARQAHALNALRLLQGQREEQAAQRTLGDQTGVRNALMQLGGGATDEQRINALRTLGTPTGFSQADALEKSTLERQKTRAEVQGKTSESEKRQFEVARERLQLINDAASSAVDQTSYAQALQGLQQAGVDVSKMPPQFDPAFVAQAKRQAMSELQRNEVAARQRGHDLTAASQAETAANNLRTDARVRSEGAANRGVQIRGQNLTDDRARDLATITKTDKAEARKAEQNDKAVTKFSDTLQKEGIPEIEAALTGAEGIFARYRDPKTGKATDIPGIGAVKNALPDWAVSSEGKDARESLSAVANIVLSARSGAAVTDQELRRLARELSNSVGASAADMERAYSKFRARFEKVKANTAAGVSDDVKRTYEERGGIKIPRGGAGAEPATLPNMPSGDAIAAELARRAKAGGR